MLACAARVIPICHTHTHNHEHGHTDTRTHGGCAHTHPETHTHTRVGASRAGHAPPSSGLLLASASHFTILWLINTRNGTDAPSPAHSLSPALPAHASPLPLISQEKQELTWKSW
eukprot:2201406-Rhodomonas_salina.3